MGPLKIVTDTFYYLQESKKPESHIDDLKVQWAQAVLNRLNVNIEVRGEVSEADSTLFVGNHISYLDMPILMQLAPRVSFVAKYELSLWPVFGAAARRIDTVFVKRESGSSRRSAREAVKQALAAGKQVAIFPSGTTCVDESKPWRRGAFEIASDLGILVQPFRITYEPLREVAYIGRDFFPWHLYQLGRLEGIQAKIEFHPPVSITSPEADCRYWQEWSRAWPRQG